MAPVRVDVEKKLLGIIPVRKTAFVIADNQQAVANHNVSPGMFMRINGPREGMVTQITYPVSGETGLIEFILSEELPTRTVAILPPSGRLDTPPTIDLRLTLLPKEAKPSKISENDPDARLVRRMFKLVDKSRLTR